MLTCNQHNFKTYSVVEWDEHCYKTKHRLEGYENGKPFNRPYPKHYMLKQFDLGGDRLSFEVAMYIKDKENKK